MSQPEDGSAQPWLPPLSRRSRQQDHGRRVAGELERACNLVTFTIGCRGVEHDLQIQPGQAVRYRYRERVRAAIEQQQEAVAADPVAAVVPFVDFLTYEQHTERFERCI